MLRKHGLIQPIKIKIKSSKNKGYSGGTLLTLKNPVSPKPMNSPSNMGGNKVSNSKRTDGGVRRIRGLSSRIEQDKKLTKLSQKLSYDDYMDKSNRAVNRQKLKNKMQELAQMSPGTRNRRLMSSSSPMSLECVAENLHKKTKTLKRKSKRLPESPDNSDDAESNMAYPLTSDLLMASTSSSEPRTNLGSNSIKSGIPSKKTKRSHSVAEVRSYVVDGIVSFPKKRNNSYRGAGGGGDEEDLGLTTPQSTPPSTPNGSQGHLEHGPHKIASIMTPMMKLKKMTPPSMKVMSTSVSIKPKAFYSPPAKIMPERTAGTVARRRLSQLSMSSEDEDDNDRRFSMRNTENIFKYKEVVVKKSHGYTQVWLFTNSPSRNAVGVKALQELNSVLQNAAKDETKAVVLCGSGSMFCSGLDLRLMATQSYDERKKTAKALSDAVRTFVDTLINFPKLMVAAVNGPAIGFGAAILPLCDIVYASDKAYFHLPYNAVGMTPEGCSSFTFPHYLGLALASELLYCGRKLTALEACTGGLVSQVLWPTTFMQEVIPRVQCMVTGSLKGLMLTKSLVRSHLRSKLEYTNESECAALKERWGSSECHKMVKNYVAKGYDQGV